MSGRDWNGDTTDSGGLADALLAAPIGVTLLARLTFDAKPLTSVGTDTNPGEIEIDAAVNLVRELSFDELIGLVLAAAADVGPWHPSATETLAVAYRWAADLGDVAAAVVDRFGERLDASLDRSAQQWWTDDCEAERRPSARFSRFDDVYGAGQFSWAGLWTVTDPAEQIRADLAVAWEMYGEPVTRWRMPVRADARIYEIRRPADWARLVSDFPKRADRVDGWEMPGQVPAHGVAEALLAIPSQRACRTAVGAHLVPDWAAVATAFDGVHLSWSGFITAEGCITDVDQAERDPQARDPEKRDPDKRDPEKRDPDKRDQVGRDVAMLRFWSSERTHWLADVFGDPSSLDPIAPDGRRQCDLSTLTALLGRR